MINESEELVLKASTMMAKSGVKSFSPGGSEEAFIQKIERRLGVRLPPSYRIFLKEYGILEVSGEEFYGELDDDLFASAIPSFVFETENGRSHGEIHGQEIMIKSSGDGADILIDCSKAAADGESPVLRCTSRYDPENDTAVRECVTIADSFGEFFSRRWKKS